MKICCRCKLEKEEIAFCKSKRNFDGLCKYCRECKRDSAKKWYHSSRHKLGHIEKVKENKIRHRKIMQDFVWNFLKTHHCVDCGENDPIVLDFDHLRDKEHNISALVYGGNNLETLIKEVEKCVIRCANCHRKKTAKQIKNYKYKRISENRLL